MPSQLRLHSIHRQRLRLYESELEKAVHRLRDSEERAWYDVRKLEQQVGVLTCALKEKKFVMPESVFSNCYIQPNDGQTQFSESEPLGSPYQVSQPNTKKVPVHPCFERVLEASHVSGQHLHEYCPTSRTTMTTSDNSVLKNDDNFEQMYAASYLSGATSQADRLTLHMCRLEKTSFAKAPQARATDEAFNTWKNFPLSRCSCSSTNCSILSRGRDIDSLAEGFLQCNHPLARAEPADRTTYREIENEILTGATSKRCNHPQADDERQCALVNTTSAIYDARNCSDEPEAWLASIPSSEIPFHGRPSDICRSMATHIDNQMSIFIDFCMLDILSHRTKLLTRPHRLAGPHTTRKYVSRPGR